MMFEFARELVPRINTQLGILIQLYYGTLLWILDSMQSSAVNIEIKINYQNQI